MAQFFAFPAMWLLLPILLTLHLVVCLLLVLVVLMQLPRSEGLGAAFGGAVTENIFGAQTTHVLAKFTVWLGVAFFAITLLLAVAYSHREPARSRIQQELLDSSAPVTTPAPTSSPAPAANTPAPAISPVATPAPALERAASPAPAATPAATAP